MAAAKIKKGDRVIVLSGKDKGRTGEVTKAMPKDGKVVVSGVNVMVRHRKPSQANPQGGLERVEALHDPPRSGHHLARAELEQRHPSDAEPCLEDQRVQRRHVLADAHVDEVVVFAVFIHRANRHG